ncbi:MAG: DUF5702 domain-containing protein [Lachnospiraceae bacterium]|nr:DUF5702 domain-containing protein [Lachnospiraceae bacterium]MDY5742806.1 DUF5702 domain-containing protein [Lachnospiraceae bacterium]
MKRGEITVFFSLLLFGLLLFLGTLLESARDAIARERTTLTTAAALQSVWAAYDQQLHNRYHLLAYDLSLGQSFSKERLQQHWLEEANRTVRTTTGDLSPVTAVRAELEQADLLTDYQGAEFRDQAVSYMKRVVGIADIEKWLNRLPEQAEAEKQQEELERLKEELPALWEKLDAANTGDEAIPATAKPDGRKTDGRTEEQPLSWLEKLRLQQAGFDLAKYLPAGFELHQGRLNDDDLFTERKTTAWEGFHSPADIGWLEEGVLAEYYLRHFSFATEPTADTAGKASAAGRLTYQVEYLLYGQNTDIQNLRSAAEAIHRLRTAINFIYLQTDMKRQKSAELPATVLATLLGEPKAKDVIKQALLFYWSTREADWEIKSLFAGGAIALLKGDASWKTALYGPLPEPEAGGGTEAGLRFSYRDYLRLLLLWHRSETTGRALNLIEYELRQYDGYAGVQLDRYMVSGRISYRWRAAPLFPFALPLQPGEWQISRKYSY